MPPRRLFAGRPPPDISSSDDDNPDPPTTEPQSPLLNNPTGPSNLPSVSVSSPPRVSSQRRKRPRFVARVVSQDLPSHGLVSKAAVDDNDLQKQDESFGREISSGAGGRGLERDRGEIDGETDRDDDDGEDDEDNEGDEDEGDDEDEEDDVEVKQVVRPVFISKTERGAVQASQASEHGVDRLEKREVERREEARRMVQDALEEEEENTRKRIEGGALHDEQLPDDEDIEEEREKEYALWRVRELKRIMRDKQEVEEWKRKRSGGAAAVEPTNYTHEKEPNQVEHGRGKPFMQSEDRTRPAFLQKFYKMGPFFLETDDTGRYKEEIYNRDYNKGTSEDGVNREALPAPMQVRRGEFGKAGRSKYTHLANEDTAAGLAGELRRDKELAEALGAARKRAGS